MLDILHESPIEADGLSICFDRQPDIFTMAELKYELPVWGGFFEGDELAGFALVGYHEAYVNGSVTPVMHLTDCYIRPQSRGRGYLCKAVPFFFECPRRNASIGYAVVMRGNRAAEAQLGERLAVRPWCLRSRKIGALVACNILIGLRHRGKPAYLVRSARADDIGEIVDLLRAEHARRLFGMFTDGDRFTNGLTSRPGLSIDNYYVVEEGGRLKGVCAAWDTRAFKQNRVTRYGLRLGAMRAASRLISHFCGVPALPAPGESFRDVFVTDWAVRDRSIDVMHAMLEHIYDNYRGRGYHSMIFGSCAGDPMLEARRGFTAVDVVSDIALFSLGDRWLEPGSIDMSLPFVDIALL